MCFYSCLLGFLFLGWVDDGGMLEIVGSLRGCEFWFLVLGTWEFDVAT